MGHDFLAAFKIFLLIFDFQHFYNNVSVEFLCLSHMQLLNFLYVHISVF